MIYELSLKLTYQFKCISNLPSVIMENIFLQLLHLQYKLGLSRLIEGSISQLLESTSNLVNENQSCGHQGGSESGDLCYHNSLIFD